MHDQPKAQFYIINVNIDTINKNITDFTSLLVKTTLNIKIINLLIVLNTYSAYSHFFFNKLSPETVNQYYFDYIEYTLNKGNISEDNPFQKYYEILNKLYKNQLVLIDSIFKNDMELESKYKINLIYLPPL